MKIIKAGTALVAVIGLGLMFLFPPAGAIVCAVAGVASLATNGVDWYMNKRDSSRLGYLFAHIMSIAREFEEIKENIESLSHLAAQRLNISYEISL